MKTLLKLSFGFFSLVTLIFFISCSDDSPTNIPSEEIKFVSYQVPGCNSSYSLEKSSLEDSCFTYIFNDTLKVDFCVSGNCCPDHDRFVTNYDINSDTIFVTVVDIAPDLCHCICNYVIHIEIVGLPLNSYLFYCHYGDLVYNEIVIKTN